MAVARARTYVFQLVLEVSEGIAEVPLLGQQFAVFRLFGDESRLKVPPLDQRVGQIALLLVAPGGQQQVQELATLNSNIHQEIPVEFSSSFVATAWFYFQTSQDRITPNRSLNSAGFLVDPRVSHRNCRSFKRQASCAAKSGAQHHASHWFNDDGCFSAHSALCITLVWLDLGERRFYAIHAT